MQHNCQELGFRDRDRIKALLENAPAYEVLLMKRAAENMGDFTGGWFGALADGRLEAIACLESNTTVLWSANYEATNTMAQRMLSIQRKRPTSSTGTHQIVGEELIVGRFWEIFQHIRRTVVLDRRRDLLSVKEPDAPPRSGLTVSTATPKEIKLVYEFSGDQTVEQWGWDPRKISPEGHKERCEEVIAEGRQLIGRDRGRPVFLAERTLIDDETVLLERLFVPRPFRRRKLVVSAVLAGAKFVLENAKECVFFADNDDEAQKKALALTNLERKATYRVIVIRG